MVSRINSGLDESVLSLQLLKCLKGNKVIINSLSLRRSTLSRCVRDGEACLIGKLLPQSRKKSAFSNTTRSSKDQRPQLVAAQHPAPANIDSSSQKENKLRNSGRLHRAGGNNTDVEMGKIFPSILSFGPFALFYEFSFCLAG